MRCRPNCPICRLRAGPRIWIRDMVRGDPPPLNPQPGDYLFVRVPFPPYWLRLKY
ncbi:hypothetical protein [Klamath virus]|uniref:Uncharacterized protein n=1 Tax=Klamath virus TaxID=909206 RepID=A0A0D3R171_9RHAB|nr:hypothetical protein [Klamath virus]AJR28408.1 hypothetical protein [Klamath virus]